MIDTKHPLRSLGIMGPAIAILVLLANQVHPGLGLTTDEVSHAVDLVDALLGCAIAIYGRWRATSQISLRAGIIKGQGS